MLTRLDDYIFQLFTKFSHWFQQLTGKTNFWWSRLTYILFCLSGTFLFPLPIEYKTLKVLEVIFVWMGSLVAMAFSFSFIWTLANHSNISRNLEKYYESSPECSHPSSLKIQKGHWRFTRAMYSFVMMQIVLSYCFIVLPYIKIVSLKLIGLTLMPLLLVSIYFIGVIPLPPGKSKVQEWKESFAAGFRKLVPLRSNS